MALLARPAVPLPELWGCEHYLAWFTFIYRNNRTPCGRGLGDQVLHGSRGPRSSLCLPSPFVIIVQHFWEKKSSISYSSKCTKKLSSNCNREKPTRCQVVPESARPCIIMHEYSSIMSFYTFYKYTKQVNIYSPIFSSKYFAVLLSQVLKRNLKE